jgi:hypothetical protein
VRSSQRLGFFHAANFRAYKPTRLGDTFNVSFSGTMRHWSCAEARAMVEACCFPRIDEDIRKTREALTVKPESKDLQMELQELLGMRADFEAEIARYLHDSKRVGK